MKSILLSFVVFFVLTVPAKSVQIEEHPCAEHTPYYHAMEPSLGTALADLFLFPGTLIIATAVGGGPRVTHYERRTRRTITVNTAWCMPASLLHHYRNRPKMEHRIGGD